MSLLNMFRPRSAKNPNQSAPQPRTQLGMERLEDRSVPSAGALDPTFGTGGLVVTDLGSTSDHAYDMVIQSDGKIVTAGDTVRSSTGQDFALVRYNTNGTLDTSFGINGRAVTDFKGAGDVAKTMAQQSDGKLVVAGYARGASGDLEFALARHNANGTLDTSFGSKGKVITTISRDNDVIEAMAIQADGKIVVAGWTEKFLSGGTGNFVVARYNTNGSLDTTFGTGGKVVTDFAGGQDHAEGVAIQTNGKITVVGKAGNSGFGLAQYNPNGSLDLSFGNQGKVTTAFGNGDNRGWAHDVVIQTDGRIVVAGDYNYFPPGITSYVLNGMAVARYDINGAPDQGFGTSGAVTIAPDGKDLSGQSLAIQANGKILVAGWYYGYPDFALARLSGVDGSVDTTFGTGGLVTTDFGATFGVTNSSDIANAVAIQADGKVVVAGSFANPSNNNVDIALARYLPSSPQIGSFTASPSPVAAVSPVTLAAANVQALNPGSTVTQVAFYTDSNGDGKLDAADTLLGYGTNTNGTWTFTFTFSTSGTYKLFAQAKDSYGVLSDPLALDLQVL